MRKNYFYKALGAILLSGSLFVGQIMANVNDTTPRDGWKIGPDYVVFEAEATDSPLDLWEIVEPGDERYYDNNIVSPINETHLEFTGNNHNGGNASSPLEYTFVCPKTAKYRLGARLFQRLEGQPEDKCNDVYIKMEGNFTSGNSVALTDLQHNQKFYGRGVDEWGALFNLEIHSTGVHSAALYNMIEGEEYTLTVSGRAQRTNIDYWLLYDNTLPIVMEAHKDVTAENDEKYRPPSFVCETVNAVDMKFTGIDGFVDAQLDNKAGFDILQVVERLEWAAAQMVYDGTDGEAYFTLNTMQETDGESSYRLKINGELVKEVVNDRIHNTDIPDYTIQNHEMNEAPVQLNNGDTIQVEFSNATNGLVPEGDLTATSRGRWVSLDVCSTGRFTKYGLFLSHEEILLTMEDEAQLITEVFVPVDEDSAYTWESRNTDFVMVDENGLVIPVAEGSTWVVVSTANNAYRDSCKVTVVIPQPYGDAPIVIPGPIEVENYDIGGEGATYHDEDAGNMGASYRKDEGVDIESCSEGGYNIGWTAAGEWLRYTVNVLETENYYIQLRVASMTKSGGYHIEVDGVDVTGSQTFPKTGGWQAFETVVIEDIDLTAGEHVIKLVIESEGWNINWMRIFVTGTVDVEEGNLDNASSVYPNPFVDEFVLQLDKGFKAEKINVLNICGQVVYSEQISDDVNGIIRIAPSYEIAPKGIYFVEVQGEGQVQTFKIMRK